MGVVSTAKFGAKVAAPPVTFQFVDAPISRMAAGSFSSEASGGWTGDRPDEVCPCAGKVKNRKTHAPASVKTRVRIEVSKIRLKRLAGLVGAKAETKSYEETAVRGGLKRKGRGSRRGEGTLA